MDDSLLEAQLGDSEARYREFSRKGQMTKEQWAKRSDVSFWTDWGIIAGTTIMVILPLITGLVVAWWAW